MKNGRRQSRQARNRRISKAPRARRCYAKVDSRGESVRHLNSAAHAPAGWTVPEGLEVASPGPHLFAPPGQREVYGSPPSLATPITMGNVQKPPILDERQHDAARGRAQGACWRRRHTGAGDAHVSR
jgi:hypothetical protein